MQCTDCPLIPNGTHKRQICCRRAGVAQAEADIIAKLPSTVALPTGLRLVRAAALSGSFMESKAAAPFHPYSWSEGERRLRGRIIGG